MAAAGAQYALCMQLEKQVRALLKEKQFYDSTVRAARAQLRNAYCAVLFQDYAGSQAKEVEQALWKSVFYRPIEEFRRRIKMSAMAGEKGKELLKKVKSAFAKFLEDAIGFYKLLALRLQATYGNVGFQLDADDAPELLNAELPPAAAQPQDCRISVYRCCICIGDLARYYEANVSEQPKKDWRVAEKYYRKAMQIFPEGGNSYNQLAVLATYTDNELGAVYHYFRSLAVPLPFLIARENLNLLFEQTRAKHAKLTASQRPGRGGGAREKLPMNLLQQQMCLGFIRLHGMLFTKINLDQFADVLAAVAADLEDFLSRPQVTKDQASRRASWVGELLIQLAAMVLFSVQNISWTPDGHKPGYSDIAARTELRQAALALAYMFIAKVAMAAVAAGNNGQLLTSPLMPCLNILLQWLATHPDVIRVQDPGGTEVASRSAAWSSLAQLVACAAGFAQRMHLSLAADEQAIQREALEEDMQLRAFVPLAEAQVSLLVGRPPPQQPYQERLLSVMASVRAIARHLDSEPDAMPIPAHPAAPAGLAAAMAQFRAAVGQAFKEEVAAPAAPQNGTEAEDDEEVIVYTPGHATSSAQKAASGAAPAATTPAGAHPATPATTSGQPAPAATPSAAPAVNTQAGTASAVAAAGVSEAAAAPHSTPGSSAPQQQQQQPGVMPVQRDLLHTSQSVLQQQQQQLQAPSGLPISTAQQRQDAGGFPGAAPLQQQPPPQQGLGQGGFPSASPFQQQRAQQLPAQSAGYSWFGPPEQPRQVLQQLQRAPSGNQQQERLLAAALAQQHAQQAQQQAMGLDQQFFPGGTDQPLRRVISRPASPATFAANAAANAAAARLSQDLYQSAHPAALALAPQASGGRLSQDLIQSWHSSPNPAAGGILSQPGYISTDSRLSQDPFSRPSSRPLSPIVGWSGTSGGAWGASAEQPPGYGRLAPAGGAHDGHILSPPPSVLPTASHLLSNGSGGSSSLFGRDMFAAARTHSSASDPRQGGQELGGRGSSLFSSFLESNQQQPQQQQQEGGAGSSFSSFLESNQQQQQQQEAAGAGRSFSWQPGSSHASAGSSRPAPGPEPGQQSPFDVGLGAQMRIPGEQYGVAAGRVIPASGIGGQFGSSTGHFGASGGQIGSSTGHFGGSGGQIGSSTGHFGGSGGQIGSSTGHFGASGGAGLYSASAAQSSAAGSHPGLSSAPAGAPHGQASVAASGQFGSPQNLEIIPGMQQYGGLGSLAGYGAAAAGGRLSQPNNPYGGLSQGSEAAYGGGPAGYGQFPGGLLEESAAAHAMDGPGRSIGAGFAFGPASSTAQFSGGLQPQHAHPQALGMAQLGRLQLPQQQQQAQQQLYAQLATSGQLSGAQEQQLYGQALSSMRQPSMPQHSVQLNPSGAALQCLDSFANYTTFGATTAPTSALGFAGQDAAAAFAGVPSAQQAAVAQQAQHGGSSAASWSWLDAFEARQRQNAAAQASGLANPTFPFPGARPGQPASGFPYAT